QLMQAQKLETLGTLAGGIAHDFNNILAGMSGFVEMLRAETYSQPKVQEMVKQLWQGVHRATDLVQRILAFSRKRAAQRKPVHLGPVIHEALLFLRPLVPQGVAVEERLPADDPLVAADAGQVHQVVINLCTNALQAMEERGGRLTVSLEAVDLDRA